MNLETAQAWLEAQQPADQLTDLAANDLRALVGSQALGSLISLMLGSRSALYVQLSNTPLADQAAVARAAVLQGQIKGIELLRDTLLELFVPVQAGEGAKDQPHG